MPGPAACCSLLLALASASLPAQVTWTQIPTTTAPTARVGHAMAHDLPRDKVVLFGGQDAGGRLADTWLFDGGAWVATSTAAAPSPRAAHAMAYDPGRDRIVLFGGIGVGGAILGDTWEWDGGNWLPAAPPTQPPARRSFPLIYHPLRGTVVLWGGYSTQDLGGIRERRLLFA